MTESRDERALGNAARFDATGGLPIAACGAARQPSTFRTGGTKAGCRLGIIGEMCNTTEPQYAWSHSQTGSDIFRYPLEPQAPPAGHRCRGRDGLGARGTAREAAELEDVMPIRRRRAAVPMRAHDGEAGRGFDGQRWDSDLGRRREKIAHPAPPVGGAGWPPACVPAPSRGGCRLRSHGGSQWPDGFPDPSGVSMGCELLWFSGQLSDERGPGHQIECGIFQYWDVGGRHMAPKHHFGARGQCLGRHGQQLNGVESGRHRKLPQPTDPQTGGSGGGAT